MMKRMVKNIILVALLLMCGCDSNGDNTYTTLPIITDVTGQQESTTESVVDTTAATVVGEKRGYALRSGYMSSDEDMKRLGVNKKLVIISEENVTGHLGPSVLSAFNEALVKEYGCDFVVEFIDYWRLKDCTYYEAISGIRELGQQADIIVTGGGGGNNSYTGFVENGLLIDLTDYIMDTEAGSVLYSTRPGVHWESVERNGRIYGVPYSYNSPIVNLVCNLSMADEFGIEVKDGFTFYDIGDILKNAEDEAFEDCFGVYVCGMPEEMLGYHNIMPLDMLCGVCARKNEYGEWEAFNLFGDAEFVKLCRTIQKYKERGWLYTWGLNRLKEETYLKKGRFLFRFSTGTVVDGRMAVNDYGLDAVYNVVAGDSWYGLHELQEGSVTGVASWSEYEDDAIKLITLLQTEERLVNLLAYGVEGVDYRYVDGEVVGVSTKMGEGGAVGALDVINMWLTHPQLVQPDNKAEYNYEIEEKKEKSPWFEYGIYDDVCRSAIEDYVSDELMNIYNEYYYGLIKGNYEDVDAANAEALKRQEAVGINELVDVINRMFEEARNE